MSKPETLLESMKAGHARLRDSLNTLSQTSCRTPKMRTELFAAFTTEFSLYSRAVRNVLYAVLENIYESEEQVLEAYGRHEILRQRIRMVAQLDPQSGEWESAFAELVDGFERHVEDEESDLFPVLQLVFDEKALEILADQLADERKRLAELDADPYPRAFAGG